MIKPPDNFHGIRKSPSAKVLLESINKIFSERSFKKILEFGSGFLSTPILANYVNENNGNLLSIETNIEWAKRMKDEFGGENVRIARSKVIIQNKKIRYDYHFGREKFDFILIDGPDKYKHPRKHMNRILSPYRMKYGDRGGMHSSFVIDNIWKNLEIGGYILVDKRISSVAYYLLKYGKKVKHHPLGVDIKFKKLMACIGKKPAKKILRKGWKISSNSLLIKEKP